MKRLLLTGGAGFIGSHLTRRLQREGYTVDVVDNLSTGRRDNLPEGVELLELDVSRPGLSERLPERDYHAVLHLAGQSAGEKSFDDPLYDLNANAGSTLQLSDWARARGIRHFLYASSMGVYGQPESLPNRETDLPLPLSFYGQSKLSGEGILRIQAERGLRTVSIRMFSIYGPGQNLADLRQGMVSIFLAYLLRGETVPVKGSLERSRDFVYIDDAVEAWTRLLHSDFCGAVNLGTGTDTQVGELIRRWQALLGTDLPVVSQGNTPGDQFSARADVTKMREVLGWTPGIRLEEGLPKMLEWARR